MLWSILWILTGRWNFVEIHLYEPFMVWDISWNQFYQSILLWTWIWISKGSQPPHGWGFLLESQVNGNFVDRSNLGFELATIWTFGGWIIQASRPHAHLKICMWMCSPIAEEIGMQIVRYHVIITSMILFGYMMIFQSILWLTHCYRCIIHMRHWLYLVMKYQDILGCLITCKAYIVLEMKYISIMKWLF